MSDRRRCFRLCSRGALVRLGLLLILLALFLLVTGNAMIGMPGRSHEGPLPPLTEAQRALAEELRRDVVLLAGEIGPRHVGRPNKLAEAAAAIEREFEAAGYAVRREEFDVKGVTCANIVVEVAGGARADEIVVEVAGGARADEIVVIGAHYDSVGDVPAANDNGSGVAATLALARRFAGSMPTRTIRFVAFVNEEPPYFQTEHMGALVHARRARERGERVVAMISLETIGCYSRQEGSQQYPSPLLTRFYPNRGDFIAFVGNLSSRGLLKRAIGTFRERAAFPSQGGALPGSVAGVGWSDHWAFWQVGYPAIMITDTAPYRYTFYHTREDTPDKLDYESTARVVEGMAAVVEDLVGEWKGN